MFQNGNLWDSVSRQSLPSLRERTGKKAIFTGDYDVTCEKIDDFCTKLLKLNIKGITYIIIVLIAVEIIKADQTA